MFQHSGLAFGWKHGSASPVAISWSCRRATCQNFAHHAHAISSGGVIGWHNELCLLSWTSPPAERVTGAERNVWGTASHGSLRHPLNTPENCRSLDCFATESQPGRLYHIPCGRHLVKSRRTQKECAKSPGACVPSVQKLVGYRHSPTADLRPSLAGGCRTHARPRSPSLGSRSPCYSLKKPW